MSNHEDYDAVVYDLDGTLVRLDVDWVAVEADLVALLREHGLEPESEDAWRLLEVAEDAGLGDAAHECIAAHERTGARTSTRLPLADEVAETGVPVGVCSLNDERAVRVALEVHGLADHVAAVVGRGTVPERKPHPGALLAVVRDLGVDPAGTLFVGDSASDEETARRAGTAFEYVGDGPTNLGL